MPNLNKSRIAGKIAKSMIPRTSSFVTALRMNRLLQYAETGAALLQGKGSGSGWQLSAEIHAAAKCIQRANPVLLDIGANYGKWAQGMAQIFPGTQKIILFEPQEECIAVLNNLDLPGKIVVPSGVTDHYGVQPFYVSDAGWGAASFYQRTETFFSHISQRQIAVPVTTLDAVLETEGIDFVDFAKFDIEGAELSAFRGGIRSFSRGAIGALALEFGSGNINSRTYFRDFWQFLEGYGFDIFRVLPQGDTLRVDQYDEDLEYFRGVSNYVCKARNAKRQL